ncbi:hypothetical protein DCC39_08620 [Pueribacillus theae]|uniref:Uncharacterized protein n=1 Tax=Pueribacillus theae TaxID=2171751 RepID=A0A2U1K2W0_9BACI|nr:hypothetical protein [Pueribacillus theae]PWA04836.1 hypothetical protein DCC39_18525 [Pueribacillus theae]PWA11846.1 hypothetical protein DCC39_08620 [Pueribacillus theae]
MIPIEVENRIANYFFHRYLPEEVMIKIVDRLLTPCTRTDEEDLDIDELVSWAIEIIDEQLEDKPLR